MPITRGLATVSAASAFPSGTGGTASSPRVPRAAPVEGRKSGNASLKMNTKMNETAMITKKPPAVMIATARRSMSFTRLMRAACPFIRSRMLGTLGAEGTAAAMGVSLASPGEALLEGPGAGDPPREGNPYSSLASSCLAISGVTGR